MNQCMGCQAGWPLGIIKLRGLTGPVHMVVGGYRGEMVLCTKERYDR